MWYTEVDNHLEQIIKTSALLAKAKGKNQEVIHRLEIEYGKNTSNLDNVAAMCFYQWFLADDKLDLADTNSVFQVTFDVLNKLEDVLEQHPEYWILWILKYKIQSFMNFNEEELIRSLEELSMMQRQNKKMPYFLVTEILLSHVCYIKGRLEQAKEQLVWILENYDEKIGILTNFFKGYVTEYKNTVLRSGEEDILGMLEQIQRKYF